MNVRHIISAFDRGFDYPATPLLIRDLYLIAQCFASLVCGVFTAILIASADYLGWTLAILGIVMVLVGNLLIILAVRVLLECASVVLEVGGAIAKTTTVNGSPAAEFHAALSELPNPRKE